MKNRAFIILFLLLTGCGVGHYYEVKEGNLRIYLHKSDADQVYFASSLDGYKLHKATKINDDTWEVQAPENNGFSYFYIVDGIVYVPACRMRESDDFGSENCIYVPGM